MSLGRRAALCFVVGGALLFFGEAIVLQLAGAILMLGAIALGTFVIASPEFLAGDEPEELEVVPWKLDALHELMLQEECSEGRSLAALLRGLRDRLARALHARPPPRGVARRSRPAAARNRAPGARPARAAAPRRLKALTALRPRSIL